MKDDLPYFSHDNDSRNHSKMKALRARFGWAGYGQFWALNEMIAGSSNAILDLSRKVVRAGAACELGMTTDALEDFLDFLADPDECGLIHYTDGLVTTDRTQEDYAVVSTNRTRKQEQYKTGKEKRKFGAPNGEISSESASRIDTEREREENREEERRGEEINNTPFSQKPLIRTNDGTARIEQLRNTWNSLGLPEMRRTVLSFFPNETTECLATVSVYSNAEIEEAMRNYLRVITEPEFEIQAQFQYKSFQSFIGKGVERFTANAKPFEVFKKRTQSQKPAKQGMITNIDDIDF